MIARVFSQVLRCYVLKFGPSVHIWLILTNSVLENSNKYHEPITCHFFLFMLLGDQCSLRSLGRGLQAIYWCLGPQSHLMITDNVKSVPTHFSWIYVFTLALNSNHLTRSLIFSLNGDRTNVEIYCINYQNNKDLLINSIINFAMRKKKRKVVKFFFFYYLPILQENLFWEM